MQSKPSCLVGHTLFCFCLGTNAGYRWVTIDVYMSHVKLNHQGIASRCFEWIIGSRGLVS